MARVYLPRFIAATDVVWRAGLTDRKWAYPLSDRSHPMALASDYAHRLGREHLDRSPPVALGPPPLRLSIVLKGSRFSEINSHLSACVVSGCGGFQFVFIAVSVGLFL